jgi:hypothetical protein
MKIDIEKIGEGKNTETIVSWVNGDRTVRIEFPTIARPVYSNVMSKVYVSVYSDRKIYEYDMSGNLVKSHNIPQLSGYQYRGLNSNKKSNTGISILYFPTEDNVGNQWRDIEQYEFVDSDPPLGDFLSIYR